MIPAPVQIAAPVGAGVHDPGAAKLQKRRNAMERLKNSAMAVTTPWRYPTGTVFVSSMRPSLLSAFLTAVSSADLQRMSIGWMQPLYQTMSSERKPPQQDPAAPEFWDQRFRTGVTPWDAGGVPTALREFALACGGPRRVLIPGCGSGWEARYLAELGWDVTALDFSAGAIAAARINLGPYGGCLVQADYFRFD